MARLPRPSERNQIIQGAIVYAQRISHDYLTLDARLRDWTSGTGGSGGPRPKGSISDPTGTAALTTDEHGQMRRRLSELLDRICRDLATVETIRREVMAPPPTVEELERQAHNQKVGALQPCANIHGCPDEAWATKAGRCENCYRAMKRNGRDRRVSGQPRG